MRLAIFVLMLCSLRVVAQNPVYSLTHNVGILRFDLKNQPGKYSIGTGTLLQKSDATTKKGKVFLITAGHVLPKYEQNKIVSFQIFLDSSDGAYFRVPLEIYDSTGKLRSFVKTDPDGNDLAVIDVTGMFVEHPQLQKFIPNIIPFDRLANKDTLIENNITVGGDIIFVGYPNTLYDKRNSFPIVRTGIIATDPTQDFYFNDEYRQSLFVRFGEQSSEKLNGFLIDANAVGGSSGSLVCTKPQYISLSKEGKLVFYEGTGMFYILGVLTNSYFGTDSILTQRSRANLGGVISASQIIKTINLFNIPDKR